MMRTRATAMIVPVLPRLGFRRFARRALARRLAYDARLGLWSGLGDPCQDRPFGRYGMRPVLCGKDQEDAQRNANVEYLPGERSSPESGSACCRAPRDPL